MTNKGFVNIEMAYAGEATRNFLCLSEIYSKRDFLEEKIRNVAASLLKDDELFYRKKILLKPNWVIHDRKINDKYCLRTNDNFLIAILEIILQKLPSQVTIGDAPIQSCNWSLLLSDNFLLQVNQLEKKYNIPVIIEDFRKVIFDPNTKSISNKPSEDKYIIFDLGKDSFLESISQDSLKFRVTNYNPDRLMESHQSGIHKYCISRSIFEADLIISVPKVKTHQKTGITCALKNLVGINGDKDYLPHHRMGGTGNGGDCYPGKNFLRYSAEKFLDKANKTNYRKVRDFFATGAALFWKLSFPTKTHQLAAGWYGNDTAWRMVMDLNKIARFGKIDGSISSEEQRVVYSLCDGIIGGQGNGPINPDPFPMGMITFSNNNELNDICIAMLMQFDLKKIPLLKNLNYSKILKDSDIMINGEKVPPEKLLDFSIPADPPPGWVNHIELNK